MPIKWHNSVVVTGQGGQHAPVLAGGGPRPRHPHQQEGDQGGRGDALRPDGANGQWIISTYLLFYAVC